MKSGNDSSKWVHCLLRSLVPPAISPPEGKETAETRVVSDGVEDVSAYPDGGAGLNGDVPQPLEETDEALMLAPRERLRQLTAEQIGCAVHLNSRKRQSTRSCRLSR